MNVKTPPKIENSKLYQRRMKNNRHLKLQEAEIKPETTDTTLCPPHEREGKTYLDELNEEYEKWLTENAIEEFTVDTFLEFFDQKEKGKK